MSSCRDSAHSMVGPGPAVDRAAGRKPLSFCALPGNQPLYSPRLHADSGRQRQPAAPSHEHCGAPRVCNAEPRQRAAGAAECEEGARERGREGTREEARRGVTGRRGARAPLPLAPSASRRPPPQPPSPASRAGGPINARVCVGWVTEPSAGRAHWPGARDPTPGESA